MEMIEEPARRRFRGGLLIPLVSIAAGIVVLGAAYAGYWLFAAAQLEARFDSWVEERQAEGYRISHGSSHQSGFPGRVRLSVPDIRVAAPAGWTWQSPRIDVQTNPFGAAPLRLRFVGAQDLRLPPPYGLAPMTAVADRLTASLDGFNVHGGGALPPMTIVGENVGVREKDAPDTDSLRIGRIEIVATPRSDATGSRSPLADGEPQPGQRLSVASTTLRLPASLASPLGDVVQRLSLQTEIVGSIEAAASPASLARWRDEGGTLELRGFALDYGPLQLTGDGTLALDHAGEPIGALSIRASGLAEVMRTLAAKGIVSPMVAAGATFLLRPPRTAANNLNGPSNPTPGSAVAVPVSLQDRKLYLGPLPIARLPSPPWVPLPEPGP